MMTIPLSWWLVVSAALFSIGMYGALSRRNGIELILNAVNINLVAFWRYMAPNDIGGQIFAIIVITIAAAEAAVALALVIAVVRRRRSAIVEELDLLKQ